MKRNNFKAGLWRTVPRCSLTTLVVAMTTAVLFFLTVQGAFASGGEEGGINPLKVNPDLAVWSAVIFLLLVLLLGKFAFGPIAKALDQREESMADQLAQVKQANVDAQNVLDQYRDKLARSDDEVSRIRKEALQDAQKTTQTILDQARQAAESEREQAKREIQAATDGALEELATRSAELATSLAGKILKEKIDPARHAQLITGALGEFEKTGK